MSYEQYKASTSVLAFARALAEDDDNDAFTVLLMAAIRLVPADQVTPLTTYYPKTTDQVRARLNAPFGGKLESEMSENELIVYNQSKST